MSTSEPRPNQSPVEVEQRERPAVERIISRALVDHRAEIAAWLAPGDGDAPDATTIARAIAARLASEPASDAGLRIDPVRLQAAMREAHGRRNSLKETYAEAIARKYNAALEGSVR